MFIIQVNKGLKLIARLARLLAPPQLEDLVVQLMRVMPLVSTEATGLKLSAEAENIFKAVVCGHICKALSNMPFVHALNIVKRVKENMPPDAAMAQTVWGPVCTARWRLGEGKGGEKLVPPIVLSSKGADFSAACIRVPAVFPFSHAFRAALRLQVGGRLLSGVLEVADAQLRSGKLEADITSQW